MNEFEARVFAVQSVLGGRSIEDEHQAVVVMKAAKVIEDYILGRCEIGLDAGTKQAFEAIVELARVFLK